MEKLFYTIGEVAGEIGESVSLVRFWSNYFAQFIKPRRNAKGNRQYTAQDIEVLKQIHYLVKEKGLKLDAAQAQLRANRDGVDKRFEVVDRLKDIKAQLLQLQRALEHREVN